MEGCSISVGLRKTMLTALTPEKELPSQSWQHLNWLEFELVGSAFVVHDLSQGHSLSKLANCRRSGLLMRRSLSTNKWTGNQQFSSPDQRLTPLPLWDHLKQPQSYKFLRHGRLSRQKSKWPRQALTLSTGITVRSTALQGASKLSKTCSNDRYWRTFKKQGNRFFGSFHFGWWVKSQKQDFMVIWVVPLQKYSRHLSCGPVASRAVVMALVGQISPQQPCLHQRFPRWVGCTRRKQSEQREFWWTGTGNGVRAFNGYLSISSFEGMMAGNDLVGEMSPQQSCLHGDLWWVSFHRWSVGTEDTDITER